MTAVTDPAPYFSVIVPAGRGSDAAATVRAVLALPGGSREVLVVGAEDPQVDGAHFIAISDPNPAVRRNEAARLARGSVLAFIDDDAVPGADWLERAAALFASADLLAVGGADPGPPDAPLSQRISDMLLAAPLIGSGVAAHERRERGFAVRRPHHIALVNLFVRRQAFENVGGLDTAIGYIGEDSALVERLIRRGRVLFDPRLVVYHRRRSFPAPFLSQRFRYRRKLGRMLAAGSRPWTPSIVALLIAPVLLGAAFVASPVAGSILLAIYALLTLAAGGLVATLPFPMWPLFPFFFLVHHATYWSGVVSGLVQGLASRRQPAAVPNRENGL